MRTTEMGSGRAGDSTQYFASPSHCSLSLKNRACFLLGLGKERAWSRHSVPSRELKPGRDMCSYTV